MNKRFVTTFGVFALAACAAGCADTANTNTANLTNANAVNANNMNTANANMMNGNMTANSNMTSGGTMQGTAAPDESEVTTVTENGETRQVRRFRNTSSSVERVEITERGGKRTARVYYRDKTVRDLPENRVEEALTATGSALADAGGYVADKTRQGVNAAGEATKDARDAAGRAVSRTAEGAKDIGSRAVEGAKEGGNAVVEGAKDVGKEAAKGAKKAGNAIKDTVN